MLRLIAFILAVTGLLVGIWFKDGYILGTAEDGLIFYNITHYLSQAEYTWMEYPGLGSPSLSLIAAKPTYILLSFIQRAGVPGFLIQAGVLWFLLVVSGIGVYLLVKELFPKLEYRYIILAVLFYWFNPISLVDVWNRFLLNYIFFFALLPIASYLYIKGLRTEKYRWSLILNVSLIFYSYAFSYMAFSIMFWIWLCLVTFFYILFNKSWKSKIFSLKYFILTLVLFIVSNSWWVLTLLNLHFSGGSNSTAELFIQQNNLGILDALSKKTGNLTEIFKLMNASFLADDSLSWVKLYYSPLLFIIQYAIVGIILYFLIKFRSDSVVLFLGTLFLSAIFLTKGSNPPFGEIYTFIFKNVLVLQIFRNPFEKFGFLLSLTASLLLGISIYKSTHNLQNKFRQLIFLFFFVFIFFILGFPLYTGLTFTNKFPPTDDYSVGYKVRVPQYYREVDGWLNSQGENFRYIGFPLKDEGITYTWEKGYAGVELSVALFSVPGILHTTSVPFFNQIVPEIEKTLLSDQDFSMLANLVNAKHYLLRYDIDYKLRAMTDPVIIEQALMGREKKGEVKKVASFGKVTIWENLNWKDNTFYPAIKLITAQSIDKNPEIITSVNILNGEVLVDSKDLDSQILEGKKVNDKLQISYKKIDSTKYLVHVKNASSPFILVFSELFNNGWRASYDNGHMIDKHLRANLYANGWLVDRNGEFDLRVEFSSQKWMDWGEIISIFSFIFLILALIFILFRFKKARI